MAIFTNPNYDFIKWRWHALAASTLVVVAGIVFMIARGGMPLGIDFTGGTIVVAKFSQAIEADRVRAALDSVPGEKVIQSYGDAADNAILIRLPQLAQEDGTSLEKDALAVVGALKAAGLPEFEILSQEIVGPVIGRELQLKGIYATLASIVGIAIYIALRFRPAFAIGAIVATLHDVAITLAFLAFFGYDLSLNIVAALLTITGYSVNDTIVIFDRVRENMRTMRRDPLEKVVNTAVNQTLSRTVITAGTTFLSVLALFLFGGEVLHGFAFTMLVAIVSGTYSTVFIAAAIAIILGNRQGAGASVAAGAGAPVKVKAATARRS
ncbi:MAG: protein translocase subunit SecF [Acidobacteria bacterium]|nr:protein translocase subunit SecF [Acidobacteriota bacterium]